MRKIPSVAAVVLAAGGLAATAACSSSTSSHPAGAAGKSTASSSAAPAAESSSPTASASSAAAAGVENGGDVEIVKTGYRSDFDLTPGKNTYVVDWKITNHGTGPADYVVLVDFLDASGDKIGGTGFNPAGMTVGAGKTATGEAFPLPAEMNNHEADLGKIGSVKVTQVMRTPKA